MPGLEQRAALICRDRFPAYTVCADFPPQRKCLIGPESGYRPVEEFGGLLDAHVGMLASKLLPAGFFAAGIAGEIQDHESPQVVTRVHPIRGTPWRPRGPRVRCLRELRGAACHEPSVSLCYHDC